MTLAQYLCETGYEAASFGRLVGVPRRQKFHKYLTGQCLPPPETVARIVEQTNGRVTVADLRPDLLPLLRIAR